MDWDALSKLLYILGGGFGGGGLVAVVLKYLQAKRKAVNEFALRTAAAQKDVNADLFSKLNNFIERQDAELAKLGKDLDGLRIINEKCQTERAAQEVRLEYQGNEITELRAVTVAQESRIRDLETRIATGCGSVGCPLHDAK